MKKLLMILMIVISTMSFSEWKANTIERKDKYGDIKKLEVFQVSQLFSTNFTDVDLYVKVSDDEINMVYHTNGIKVVPGKFYAKDDRGKEHIFYIKNGVARGVFSISGEDQYRRFIDLIKKNKTIKVSYKAKTIHTNTEYIANAKIDGTGFTKQYNKLTKK